MSQTVDSLRTNTTDLQRVLLNKILGTFTGDDSASWPTVREVQVEFGKSEVESAITGLPPGSIFVENSKYQITLLGALISTKGPLIEQLLVAYLEYMRTAVKKNPKLTLIRSDDFALVRSMTDEESRLLRCVISMGLFWGNQNSLWSLPWWAGVPEDVADLLGVADLRAFIHERAMSRAIKLAETRAWSGAERPKAPALSQIEVHPPVPQGQSLKKRWKPLAAVLGAVVLVGSALHYGSGVLDWFGGRSERIVQGQEDRKLLREISGFLESGDPSGAVDRLRSYRQSRGNDTKWSKEAMLALRLTEGFGDSVGWDSEDSQGRRELFRQLLELPQPRLSRELQILLRYRIESESAGVFFPSREESLTLPYVRVLAARETHAPRPRWSKGILESVLRDPEAQSDEIRAITLSWLAHVNRRLGLLASADSVLDVMASLVGKFGLKGTAREVRYHGERLAVARLLENAPRAEQERAALEGLADEAASGPAHPGPPEALNALFWLARDDAMNGGGRGCEFVDRALTILRARAALRKEFSYVSAMLPVQCVAEQLSRKKTSPKIAEVLRSALGRMQLMSGGPYHEDLAYIFILLGKHHLLSGRDELALEMVSEAEAHHAELLETGAVFSYELELAWLRARTSGSSARQ